VFVLDFDGRGAVRSFLPPADVSVTEDEVTVVMDVPGLTASELDVELLGDRLTVRGERACPHADDEARSWQLLERGFGRFVRILQVPEGLDPDGIVASLTDGVLTLVIPMPEARKPHRIEILGGEERRGLEAPAGSVHDRDGAPAGANA
jgi:HSP20 family protein